MMAHELKQPAELFEKVRTAGAKPVNGPSNGLEYLCDSDTCEMVVCVVLGDSAGGQELRLQCQDCNRLFEFPWIAWQWESGLKPDAARRPWREEQQGLFEVVEEARNGNEGAKNKLCKILGNELKPWIERRLKMKLRDQRDAHQEVILRVLQKIEQLRAPENFLAWLHRVAVDVAKQHWTPYLRTSKTKQKKHPEQIGTKTIVVDGKPHVVRVFELCRPEPPRKPILKPLDDSIIVNWSKANRPNYPRNIDVWQALEKLPERWALAIWLVKCVGLSAEEAAKIMGGCSRGRIFKLVQKAKYRLQELLPGYDRNGKATLQEGGGK